MARWRAVLRFENGRPIFDDNEEDVEDDNDRNSRDDDDDDNDDNDDDEDQIMRSFDSGDGDLQGF